MKTQATTRHMLLSLTVAVIVLTGCRGGTSDDPPVHLNRNMDTQEKYTAQRASGFFADGKAMRTPPEGTVARGQLREDPIYFTGKDAGGVYVPAIPFEVDEAALKRGAERFGIYCSPCHGFTGDGKGKIMEYKYPIPPTNLYEQRIYDMADGNIFEVISNGVRNMPSYREQIPVRDRWCIVAHVRTLQTKGTPVPSTTVAAPAPTADAAQSTPTNSTETAQ